MKRTLGGLLEQLRGVSQVPERELWWITAFALGKPERHLRATWLEQLSRNTDTRTGGVTRARECSERSNSSNKAKSRLYAAALADLMSEQDAERISTLVTDRVEKRKPLQYILGDVDFAGLTLKLRPPTLIPRPETEQMCAYVLSHVKALVETISEGVDSLDESNSVEGTGEPTMTYDECHRPGGQSPDWLEGLTRELAIASRDKTKLPRIPFYSSWYGAFTFPDLPLRRKRTRNAMKLTLEEDVSRQPAQRVVRVLDVCSGSGAIALGLAANLPGARWQGGVTCSSMSAQTFRRTQPQGFRNEYYPIRMQAIGLELVDSALSLSLENLELARKSLRASRAHDVEYVVDASFHKCDIFSPLDTIQRTVQNGGKDSHLASSSPTIASPNQSTFNNESKFDLIVSNPPYIPSSAYESLQPEVRLWEDKLALCPPESSGSSDPEALQFYSRIVELYPSLISQPFQASTSRLISSASSNLLIAARFLPRLVFEIGTEEQAQPIAEMMRAVELVPAVFEDASTNARWIVGYLDLHMSF